MATKSKNTSYFKGVISWLCLMITICGTVLGVSFLISVIFDPTLQSLAISVVEYFRVHAEIPSEVLVLPAVVLAPFVAAVIFAFAFKQDRNMFEAAIARLLGKLWVEVKLAIIFFTLLFSGILAEPVGVFWHIMLCVGIIILYFLCLDIGHNKRFFRHNILHTILRHLNNYSEMTTFQQRSLRRIYSCIGVIFTLIIVCGFVFIAFIDRGAEETLLAIAALVFGTVGIFGTVWWYILALKADLRDWNILMAQIAEMYGGNLDAVNHVPPTSNLYDCAMQLNMIRTGIQKTVEEGIKADRTKVELITNVSHDLKTPLTSIISYVELLKKEPDLPPHIMDYVNTISNKADRLSHMVQDVFDVSKATTGNITLDMKDLDIGKLLQQTFVEMDETIKNSKIVWRVEIPEVPIIVNADGQRLYRVFQNLIRNCAQYSLEGSRAYVNLISQNGIATVSIRNISRSEITVNGSDLTARFVRGDQNRTTEGSGLGLSIAKSFTEACGGRFYISTNGDLFTVTVQFRQVLSPQPVQPQPQQN